MVTCRLASKFDRICNESFQIQDLIEVAVMDISTKASDHCYHIVNISYKLSVICVLVMLIQSAIKNFIQDEDVSLISFKTFHDEPDHLYPTTTMCFYNPFIENELKKYGPGINTTSYSQYLQGKLSDERMKHISYDNVTVSMNDYLMSISGKFENGSYIWIYRKNAANGLESTSSNPPYYTNLRTGLTKCFSFDIPFIHQTVIWSWYIKIKTSIHPQGKRFQKIGFNGNDESEGGLKISFHYPNQRFRSNFNMKYQWSEPTTVDEVRKRKRLGYYMQFRISSIEVLTHRNKEKHPCNNDWKNDDTNFINHCLKDAGCTPPQLKCCNLPVCATKEKLSQTHEILSHPTTKNLKKYYIPCREIEKLQYEYTEGYAKKTEDENTRNEWFQVRLYFPDTTFKYIEQV